MVFLGRELTRTRIIEVYVAHWKAMFVGISWMALDIPTKRGTLKELNANKFEAGTKFGKPTPSAWQHIKSIAA